MTELQKTLRSSNHCFLRRLTIVWIMQRKATADIAALNYLRMVNKPVNKELLNPFQGSWLIKYSKGEDFQVVMLLL